MSVARFLDLAGRTAVVSGASGGIGGAVARALAAQGCRVVGLDVAAPRTPLAHGVEHVDCDLRSADGAEQAISGCRLAQLDFVVNVAGIDPKHSLQAGGVKEWASIHDLNLRGYYLLIRAAAPLLAAGRGRSIVNVASINTNLGVRRRSIYSASKAGVLGLTTGLARELGDARIRINAVSPGWVMTEEQKAEYGFGTPKGAEVEAYLDGVQSLRAKRIEPDEIANVVLFLLSSASGAITGTNITADAGWRLQ